MRLNTLMAEITPAVLTNDPAEFGHLLNKLKFARRIHIDVASPPFTPNRTVNLAQLHLPEGTRYDLHLMLKYPKSQTETVISLKPHLVIIHAEAEGDLQEFILRLAQVGIKTGLALLPETSVASVAELIKQVDHVLIFTGNLGHYGGELNRSCLSKINQVKAIKDIEVSVDGGIKPDNAAEVVGAGADVLISGGFIANADHPESAYEKLQEAAR